MSIVPVRSRSLIRLAAALAVLLLLAAGCNTMPDKKALQYLNTDGFGNRYTGNAEEENWVAIGDSISLTDEHHPDELNGTFGICRNWSIRA